MAVIRLIRHGQASFGAGDYDRLSDLGKLQSQLLGRSLKRRVGDVDLVVCGAMRRHRETAEIALEAMGANAELVVDERWNEFDHQEVIARHKPIYRSKTVMVADLVRKGDPRHQFQLLFDDALARWTSGEHDDQYAEPWARFAERSRAAVGSIAEDETAAKSVLVFTSGGPVSAVTAELLGLDAEGWMRLNRTCANASETKVVSGRTGLSLVTWNAHPWFDADRELLSYR